MAVKYLKKSPKTSSTDDTKTTGIVQDLLKDIENTKEQGCIDLTKKFDKYDGDIIVSKERIEEIKKTLDQKTNELGSQFYEMSSSKYDLFNNSLVSIRQSVDSISSHSDVANLYPALKSLLTDIAENANYLTTSDNKEDFVKSINALVEVYSDKADIYGPAFSNDIASEVSLINQQIDILRSNVDGLSTKYEVDAHLEQLSELRDILNDSVKEFINFSGSNDLILNMNDLSIATYAKVQDMVDGYQAISKLLPNVNDSEFISKWVTESLNEEIQLPFFENNIIDIIIDWGDNVIEMKTTENVISKTPPTGESNIKHTYVNPGTYMIKIYGTIDKFSFQYPNYVSRNKIMSIENWGRTMMKKADLQYTNSPYIRKISGNFNPELNDLSKFFAYTTIEIPDTSNWDVSRVTNMSDMFRKTLIANPNTSKWDVSRVTNMCGTFSGSDVANPDVSNWDVSGVTNMYSMFGNAKVANPNVSNWNVSGVTNIKNMFVNSALSTTNYDNLLKGWSSLPTITSNLIFTASTNPYTISISQKNKDKLINSPNNWVIYDEGGV